MRRGLAGSVLIIGLVGATAAFAQAPPVPARHRHGSAGAGRSAAPLAAPSRQLWDNLVKGSPDQQAAERRDNELAGVKPIDHRKDEFFSDWRGLR